MREFKISEAKGLGMASKTTPNLQRYVFMLVGS